VQSIQLAAFLAVLVSTPAGVPEKLPQRPSRSSASLGSPVVANDNRMPAGTLANGVLSLELRAAVGVWRPGSEDGPALTVQAFGAGVAALSVPAPLIRIPEGTQVDVRVRNELPEPMRVFGFCDRGAATCAALEVPGGETRQVRFASGPAGTYQYWASTSGMPQQFRAADDTQLSGAFVVDPPGVAPGNDRIFVITEWTSLTRPQLMDLVKQDDPGAAFLKLRPDVLFVMNGRVWPHTERLRHELGESVRWRVINLSTQVHPMHLHGFYFDVESLGDGVRDRTFAADQRPRVVTQVMPPGSTMGIAWKPERAGNWLFHCHVMTHVSPTLHVDGTSKPSGGHSDHHLSAGMTGMVLGITVDGPEWTDGAKAAKNERAPRKLTLLMQPEAGRFGTAPAYGFVRGDDAAAARGAVPVPGPTLVLARDEPVEITLVNNLPEATAIHWHGMELESYYDGVHGWSGSGQRITPMIEPGGSFVVRFTPPKTGTFMYHTHLHDRVQLTSGLYGAMLVVEPGEALDEATDHVVIIGRGGPQPDSPVVLNNDRELKVVWKAGSRHRLRLINITPDDIVSVALTSGDTPVKWRPLTKDGASVPTDQGVPVLARQVIGVGETYDFEFETPRGRQNLWLEVRTTGGRWHTQGRVIVR
jgi:FtsP/CotA-like multicopper oxidase with cupredoxin domain